MSRRTPTLILTLFALFLLPEAADAQARPATRPLTFEAEGGPPSSTEAPQAAAGTSGRFKLFVQGGFNTTGSVGVALGAGATVPNILQNADHSLKFDVIWSNAGTCFGCDDFGTVDFSVTQFSVAGAFLYDFDQRASGWTPFAGGGIVIIRTNLSWDDEVFDVFNFDTSVTHGGIQIQGGLKKTRTTGRTVGVEARIQYAGGGGFLLLGFLGL